MATPQNISKLLADSTTIHDGTKEHYCIIFSFSSCLAVKQFLRKDYL